ncbi:MAG: hypothetical protein NTW28_02200 [Candidatus Solibacter sp.]|nr:hypothetical protein [Candidatus Solibacter sp.]
MWPVIGDKTEIMEVGDQTGPIPLAGSPAKIEFFETFLTKLNPDRWVRTRAEEDE